MQKFTDEEWRKRMREILKKLDIIIEKAEKERQERENSSEFDKK